MKLTFPKYIAILPAAIAMLWPTPCSGTPVDSTLTARIADNTSPITRLGAMVFDINPGAAAYRQSYTLGSLRATGDYLHQDKPVTVQDGDGHMTGALTVESYMRLRKNTVVWGGAEFRTGQFHNIRWNNCSDYSRVAPYVIGDSVGGDVQSRHYTFNGGYAGVKGRWSWGAQASYRANIDYRNRDPRVKIIVSDLNIDLGGSYQFNPDFALGFSGGINIYVQESDLEFYNPINTIQTYAMTGLGTTYHRFSGNSTKSTAYSGIGYHASLQLFSPKATGLRLAVDYNYIRIDQILRDYNNLTLCYTGNHLLSGQASYTAVLSSTVTLGAQLNASWQRRIGTENLFGTSVGNNYERISSRSYYYNDIVTSGISVPVQLSFGKWQIISTPQAGFDYNRESYHRPHRDLECHGYTYGLGLEGRWLTNRTLVRIGAHGAYGKYTADKQILTGLGTGSSIAQMVNSNFAMLHSDRIIAGASLGIDYAINASMALFADIRYNLVSFADNKGDSNHLIASIGVRL